MNGYSRSGGGESLTTRSRSVLRIDSPSGPGPANLRAGVAGYPARSKCGETAAATCGEELTRTDELTSPCDNTSATGCSLAHGCDRLTRRVHSSQFRRPHERSTRRQGPVITAESSQASSSTEGGDREGAALRSRQGRLPGVRTDEVLRHDGRRRLRVDPGEIPLAFCRGETPIHEGTNRSIQPHAAGIADDAGDVWEAVSTFSLFAFIEKMTDLGRTSGLEFFEMPRNGREPSRAIA